MILVSESVEDHPLVQGYVLAFHKQESWRRRPEQNRGSRGDNTGSHRMAVASFLGYRIAQRDPFSVDCAYAVDRKIELPRSSHVPFFLRLRDRSGHTRAVRNHDLI